MGSKGQGPLAPQAFPGKPLRLNERHIWLSSFEATQRLVVITAYPEKLKKSPLYNMKFARTRVFEIRRQPNRSQTLKIPPFPPLRKSEPGRLLFSKILRIARIGVPDSREPAFFDKRAELIHASGGANNT